MMEPASVPPEPDGLTAAGRQAWLEMLEHVAGQVSARDNILLGQLANLIGACNQEWRSGATPPIAALTWEMISRDGFRVIEGCNGHEALARLETEPADVILLDLLMPEMDGFAFLDELRKHDQLKELPVVVLTAKDLTEEDHVRLNGGAARVLQKGASGARTS